MLALIAKPKCKCWSLALGNEKLRSLDNANNYPFVRLSIARRSRETQEASVAGVVLWQPSGETLLTGAKDPSIQNAHSE